MPTPSTPRLALARDLMRVAVLQAHVGHVIQALSHRVYRMSDETFEEQFLDVIAEREVALKREKAIRKSIYEKCVAVWRRNYKPIPPSPGERTYRPIRVLHRPDADGNARCHAVYTEEFVNRKPTGMICISYNGGDPIYFERLDGFDIEIGDHNGRSVVWLTPAPTLFHDHGEFYTPQVVLEGIADAGDEMNYSNYHNRLFRIAERVIRAYCAEHAIDLGPTQKEREMASRSSLDRSLAEIVGLATSLGLTVEPD